MKEIIEKIAQVLDQLITTSNHLHHHQNSVLKLVKNDLENAVEHMQLLEETEANILQVKKIEVERMALLRYFLIKFFYFDN